MLSRNSFPFFKTSPSAKKANENKPSSGAWYPGNLFKTTTQIFSNISYISKNFQKSLVAFTSFALLAGVKATEEMYYFVSQNNDTYRLANHYDGCEIVDIKDVFQGFINCNATFSDNPLDGHYELIKKYDVCNFDRDFYEIELSRNQTNPVNEVLETCLTTAIDIFLQAAKEKQIKDVEYFFIPLGGVLFIAGIATWIYCNRPTIQNNVVQPPSVLTQVIRRITSGNISFHPPEHDENYQTYSDRLNLLDHISPDRIVVPKDLSCPSGMLIINDPITASSGIAYDRAGLTRLFREADNPDSIPCLKTGLPIKKEELRLNFDKCVKEMIYEFVDGKEKEVNLARINHERSDIFSVELAQRELVENAEVNQDEKTNLVPVPANSLNLLPTKRIEELEKKFPELIVPIILRCPITTNVMDDPVTLTSGITYERSAIKEQFQRKKKPDEIYLGYIEIKCPVTNMTIREADAFNFKTNVIMKKWTDEYLTYLESSPIPQESYTECFRRLVLSPLTLFHRHYAPLPINEVINADVAEEKMPHTP
jgi:hypothetical protein